MNKPFKFNKKHLISHLPSLLTFNNQTDYLNNQFDYQKSIKMEDEKDFNKYNTFLPIV